MTQLVKRGRNGNMGLFPPLRNDFWNNRLSIPRLFDFDEDFFNETAPPVNISETNKTFQLELSVPGMKKEDFKIEMEDRVLTISSEKEEERKEEDKNYRRMEFSCSSFTRSFTLPDNVDENNIHAKYSNGMLEVTLPKKEATISQQKKEISVS